MESFSTILIADSEANIPELLKYSLALEGYKVFLAKDGVEAIEQADKVKPDLIILEISLPYKNGFEVCEILKGMQGLEKTLVMFLSADISDYAQIKAYDLGSNDFVKKPVTPKLLIARINTLLKRNKSNLVNDGIVQIGNIIIDPLQYLVIYKSNKIKFPRKEFALLHMLASKPEKVFLREEILDKIWGKEVIVGARTIDVHIRKIRQKIGAECIVTFKSIGYRFVAEEFKKVN